MHFERVAGCPAPHQDVDPSPGAHVQPLPCACTAAVRLLHAYKSSCALQSSSVRPNMSIAKSTGSVECACRGDVDAMKRFKQEHRQYTSFNSPLHF